MGNKLNEHIDGSDMITIFVTKDVEELLSKRFEMAKVDTTHGVGFIFSAADVRSIAEEYGKDCIIDAYFGPYITSNDDLGKAVNIASLEHVDEFEERLFESIGDLPAGYTDEDLAEFLDKEEKNPMPEVNPEDEPYDPSDEVIQFIYLKPEIDDVQDMINNTFDSGYMDDSSMATVGELRSFIRGRDLDIADFKIFDMKGNEYYDTMALIYDSQSDSELQQESMELGSSCETPGCEHCANCGADLDDETYGGELYGDKFCKGCYEHELEESLDKDQKNKLTESIIAGPNGLAFSSEKNSAKQDAADKLLQKIGLLDKGSKRFVETLNESDLFNGIAKPKEDFPGTAKLVSDSVELSNYRDDENYKYWRTSEDPIDGNGIIVVFTYDRRAVDICGHGTICQIRSGDYLETFYSDEDFQAFEALTKKLEELHK